MSDYNEQTLMEAVIKRVAGAPDPRLRQIMTSLVTHLHGFVQRCTANLGGMAGRYPVPHGGWPEV